MVSVEMTVRNGPMEPEHGWISYTAEDNSHLTEAQRHLVEERISQREESRGGLLGIVEVRVYENECEPQISFPRGALLGIDAGAPAMDEIDSGSG
jgi:hypothetical protein